MNAFTGREATAFYARVPAGELAMAVDLLADVVVDPAFHGDDVEVERDVILDELAASLDTPDDRIHVALTEAVFPDHPLGREVIGSVETVTGLDRDTIADFHRRYYRTEDLLVAVAGPVDHDDIVRRVTDRFPGGHSDGLVARTPPGEAVIPVDHGRPARRADPHRAGLALPALGASRPVRPGRGQSGPRRGPVQPPVPGDPREAGPGVLGLVVALALLGRRTVHGLRRDGAGAGHRRARTAGRRSRPPGRRRHHPGRAGHRRRLPDGLAGARPGGHGQPPRSHRQPDECAGPGHPPSTRTSPRCGP